MGREHIYTAEVLAWPKYIPQSSFASHRDVPSHNDLSFYPGNTTTISPV